MVYQNIAKVNETNKNKINPPPPYHQPIPDMIRWDIGQSQPITAVGVGFAKMDFQKYFAANVTFVYV